MKKVLITGSNGSIGSAICEYYLKHNYEIICHYNSSSNNIKKFSGSHQLQGDFSNKKSLLKFIKQLEKYGPIDILINNAGDTKYKLNLQEYTYEDISKIMSINTFAPFLLCKEVIGDMRDSQWGRIVNISSIGVKYGGSYNTIDYTFSKAALESFTTSLAKQYSEDNILINCIRAGVMETEMHKKNPLKNMSKRISLIPINRMAQPLEIAKVVYSLGSESNTYISGETVTVAGGE